MFSFILLKGSSTISSMVSRMGFNKICLIVCLLPVIFCRNGNMFDPHPRNANRTKPNEVIITENNYHLPEKRQSTLLDIGNMVLKMVKSLASNRNSKELNLKDLIQFMTVLVKSYGLVDNPKQTPLYFHSEIEAKLSSVEEKLLSKLKTLSDEQQRVRQNIELLSQKAGVTTYLATSTSAQDTPIKFSNVISQQGKYYDDSLGTFSCPVDGEYFVSATLTSLEDTRKYWSVSIIQEGGKILAYSEKGSDDDDYYYYDEYDGWFGYESSLYNTDTKAPYSLSTSAIAHCQAGRRLWVEFSGSPTLYGTPSVPHSFFSAYLITSD